MAKVADKPSRPARREPTGPMWKNRIVGHGVERPAQLLAHPLNWRGHPIEHQNVVEEILDRVGWVQRSMVNRRTGHVVDGHLRVDLAMRRDEEEVPVTYIDVDEDEETLILTALDPSSAMAFTDHEKLNELVNSLPEDLRALTAVLREDRKRVKVVAFDTSENYRVVVECHTASDQEALLIRLTDEGFTCRTE